MARQGPGRPHRWMAALDRIRLTGLLRKSPASAGLFYAEPVRIPDEVRHPLFARYFDRLSRSLEREVGPQRASSWRG